MCIKVAYIFPATPPLSTYRARIYGDRAGKEEIYLYFILEVFTAYNEYLGIMLLQR